jgi:hypothetical protein
VTPIILPRADHAASYFHGAVDGAVSDAIIYVAMIKIDVV